MGRKDLAILVAVVAFGVLAGLLGVWIRDHQAAAGPGVVEAGQRLPELTLPALDGGPDRRLDGRGRMRLLNYWASWCGPCREEMPVLDEFARAQGDNGVEVIGIALDSPDAARAFVARMPVGFTLLVEAPGHADSSVVLGNRRGILPFTVLVDAEGRLLKSHYGAFASSAEVAAWVARR